MKTLLIAVTFAAKDEKKAKTDLQTALEFTSDKQTRLKILKLLGNDRSRP